MAIAVQHMITEKHWVDLSQAISKIDSLADQYELSPGSIMKVVNYIKEKSTGSGTPVLYKLALKGIQKESGK